MKALVTTIGPEASPAIRDIDPPGADAGELLIDGLALGICGTDREIAQGSYGFAPPDRDWLVLGHESLGRVREAPTGSGFSAGDLVAGIVRRPDPEPCPACAHDEWDMCRNGRYTERGIKELDGYGSEQWRVPAEYAVRVADDLGLCGVLTEPTSVVAKAWEQVERVGQRAWFEPARVLVTGAGPVGLLAALLGRQRGLDVHVLDVVEDGPKPQLVRDLGATYHHDGLDAAVARCAPDIVMEATGIGSLVLGSIGATRPYGIVCLTGVSSGGHKIRFDAGMLNRELVLENDAIVGSVNANRRHYQAAADALADADRGWLRSLITRVVGLDDFADALAPDSQDVKVVIVLSDEVREW